MRLWYEKEAKMWQEALPIGNGRLGAMVWGGQTEEILSLNEDTLWSGELRDTNNYKAYEHLDEIRSLIFKGENYKAQKLLEQHYFGPWNDSYLPMGELRLRMIHNTDITDYVRDLTFDNAIATVKYQVDGVNYHREMFATYVDDVIAVKISADLPGSVTLDLSLSSQLVYNVKNTENGVFLEGQAPYFVEPSYTPEQYNPHFYGEGRGMRYGIQLAVVLDGGKLENYGSSCGIRKANSVVIYITGATSFNGFDKDPYTHGKNYTRACEDVLTKVIKKDYEEVKKQHIEDFAPLYSRVEFDLGGGDDKIPVDKRLDIMKKDVSKPSFGVSIKGPGESDEQLSIEGLDNGLVEMMFQYGRYLLISSSRPGTQPANLQGIWNKDARAPWSSNLTTNINAQMNYWHAEVCNLSECHEPLFDAIRELSITGEKTAKVLYGCNGFTVHHNVDIWRNPTPVAGNCKHSMWPVGAGWLCRHLWEHYLHTMDEKFLRETAYPLMKKSAEFFMDFLVKNEDGYLVTNPSTSPENHFKLDGQEVSVSTASTMDMDIIRDLFGGCIQASKVLDSDADFAAKLQSAKDQLFPYKIGQFGQLQEWDQDYIELEAGHRHVSHLYGVYPACEITEGEMFEASAKSLERRLAHGGGYTGWSCAWIINLFSRLKDSENTLKYVATLLKRSTYPNLFDAHPPFQIDGNFGFTSGIAEMLMQSHRGFIDILPTLPVQWEKGSIRGLIARGAFEVDITWENCKCTQVDIQSKVGGKCAIKYENSFIEFETQKGGAYTINTDDSGNLTLSQGRTL